MPSAVATQRLLLVLLTSGIACFFLAPSHASADTSIAPTTASTDVAAQVDTLIALLSSDDWPRRQDAEEQLVQLGPDAVPRLREVAGAAEDAEVRTRCESALHRIARNERVGATIVTLHLAGAAPRDAFEALARQSGAPLRPYPPTLFDLPPAASARVTLDVERQPFWEVARRLTATTGLELRPWNDELRVTAAAGGDRRQRGPSTVSGPLLIVANSVNRMSNVDLGTGTATNDFSVTFTVVPEPKLRVLRSWSSVRVEEAVDENGTSLAPTTPLRQDAFHSIPRQAAWPAAARLKYPPNAGDRIARLRGSVTFVAQTQSETIEVRDLLGARDVRREVGGGVIMVQSCRQVGNQYEIALVLSRGRGTDTLPWDQFQQSSLPGLRVYDADGRPLQRGQPSRTGSNQRLEITVRFVPEAQPPQPRPGPPARLVWEIPTESREITAPFEFTDLPLP